MYRELQIDGLRLLSLDGGGIRGLSELLILREIMSRIQNMNNLESLPLPCEYFDIIGGTGTGGLIALMLGRLRMSVDEAINHYGILSKQVFSKVKLTGDGKFMASELEKVFRKIVGDMTQDADARMMDLRSDGKSCRTFVCAMPASHMAGSLPRLFRTYRVPNNESFDCTIWEAARATTAAPPFFKGIDIGLPGLKELFLDDTLGRNNPVGQVLEESELVFPDKRVACVISIGTGQAETIAIPKLGVFSRIVPSDILKNMIKMASHCQRTAEETERRFTSSPNLYFRFNVDQGMQNVTLAQWERLGEVTTHTNHYLLKVQVDQKVTAAVRAISGQRGFLATAQLSTFRPEAELHPMESTIIIPESDAVKPTQDEAAPSDWYFQMTPGNSNEVDDPSSLTYEDALAVKAGMKPAIRQQLKDNTMQSIVKLRIRNCDSEQELQSLKDQLAALDASYGEISAFIDSRRSLMLHAEAVIDAHEKEAFRRKGLPLYYTPELNISDTSLSDEDP